MSEKSVFLDSPEAGIEESDEQGLFGGDQPTAEEVSAPEDGGDTHPEGKDDVKAEVDYEKRFKDTQRALNEAREAQKKMEGQLELLIKQQTSSHNAPPAGPSAEELKKQQEELFEAVREDPAKAIEHVWSVLDARDAYWENKLNQLNGNMSKMSPEYSEHKETIDGLRGVPQFANMSDAEILAVAKEIDQRAPKAKPVMKPQGSPVGDRGTSTQKAKPVSSREKYMPWLIASGAISQDTQPKGVIKIEKE